MKLMFASDIHGSFFYCQKLIDAFNRENPERLILLGDILYHGPRNDLPKEYSPKKIIPLLNSIKEKLLCVRGNCDSEVDQMVLEFSITADFSTIYENGRMFFITHGHIYNEEKLPLLNKGDILIHGHTHIQVAEDRGNYIFLNPGSVSLPKENDIHSYMIYENGIFTIKDFENNTVKSLKL